MADPQTKGGQRVSAASGGSSEAIPPVSLIAGKRPRGGTSPTRRVWNREDAPWHRNGIMLDQEVASGPMPFLPARFLPGPSNQNRPQAGPDPFTPGSTNDGQQERAQSPFSSAPARLERPPITQNEPLLTEADLHSIATMHDVQADCPLCNSLTLQVGSQRRCMMFPGCPFNWRVGWAPYW